MKIELRKTSEIKPYANNPRINDDAVNAVAASLKEFGWRQPIVVDAEGVIIVGHTRWKAAQELGLEKVSVHVATDLTPAQIKAYRIADNQTNTLAEWDFNLLPIELHDLQNLDFDMSLLGFDVIGQNESSHLRALKPSHPITEHSFCRKFQHLAAVGLVVKRMRRTIQIGGGIYIAQWWLHLCATG